MLGIVVHTSALRVPCELGTQYLQKFLITESDYEATKRRVSKSSSRRTLSLKNQLQTEALRWVEWHRLHRVRRNPALPG